MYSTEEERQLKRKESLAKAKAKYSKTEKGKQCSKKYYETNKEAIYNLQKQWRGKTKIELIVLKEFYEKYKNDHPDFEPLCLKTEPV